MKTWMRSGASKGRMIGFQAKGSQKAAIEAMKLHLRSMFNAIARLKPLHEDYFTDD